MRILFLADLHWRPLEVSLKENDFKAFLKRNEITAIVVCGDLGNDTVPAELRRLAGEGVPIAVALGNHDFWRHPERRDRLTFEDLTLRHWKPLCDEAGVILLDERNLDLADVTIVGGYGHYDLGFAMQTILSDEGSAIPITEEDYLLGGMIGKRGMWQDVVKMPSGKSLFEEARLQRGAIVGRIDEAIVRGGRVLVALHTIPFHELNGHEPDFFRAYSGNALLGLELLLKGRAERIELLVCGHTHLPAEGIFGGMHCVNVGSDYRQLQGIVYDSFMQRVQWVDILRGDGACR